MTRQEANRKILKLLGTLLQETNDLRFGQLIISLLTGTTEQSLFNEEPEITLEKMLNVTWVKDLLEQRAKENTSEVYFNSIVGESNDQSR